MHPRIFAGFFPRALSSAIIRKRRVEIIRETSRDDRFVFFLGFFILLNRRLSRRRSRLGHRWNRGHNRSPCRWRWLSENVLDWRRLLLYHGLPLGLWSLWDQYLVGYKPNISLYRNPALPWPIDAESLSFVVIPDETSLYSPSVEFLGFNLDPHSTTPLVEVRYIRFAHPHRFMRGLAT